MKKTSEKIIKAFSKKAFIPFIMLADPDYDSTIDIAKTLECSGASLIELGLPSINTPLDGSSVKKAHERALKNNFPYETIFDLIIEIKSQLSIPILIMAYLSVLAEYGFFDIIKKFEDIGIDGMIIPDLFDDRYTERRQYLENSSISFISVINPYMSDSEILAKTNLSDGFIYIAGGTKTGNSSNSITEIEELIHRVKSIRDIPTAIGFGIRTCEDAKIKSTISDGIIIGSAIVDIIGDNQINYKYYLENYAKEIIFSIR